jgi:hypothetical protein
MTLQDSYGPPRWWMPLLAILMVASIAMAAVATVLQVADLDVDTRVGIVDFKLDTDWKAGSVTYTGSASEFGVDVEGEQVLLEGTGDFQAAVGFLKGTSKRVTNSISPFTTDYLGTHATLNVSVSTETIPWWVVGTSTPCSVEVELIESMNVSSLTVDRVWMEFRRVVDGESLKKEVWSKQVSDALSKVGDKRTYTADLELDEDWGEFHIFGMVEVTMVDTNGITATQMKKSYSTQPKVITIWTIPTGDGVRIALLIAAQPVFLVGMLAAALGTVTIVLDRRGKLLLPLLGASLLLLGAIFFMLGVSQLAELVGYPDDLSYTGCYYLMLLGFVPAMVAGVLVAYGRRTYGTGEEEDEDRGDELMDEETYVDGALEGDAGDEVPSAENTNTLETYEEEEDRS